MYVLAHTFIHMYTCMNLRHCDTCTHMCRLANTNTKHHTYATSQKKTDSVVAVVLHIGRVRYGLVHGNIISCHLVQRKKNCINLCDAQHNYDGCYNNDIGVPSFLQLRVVSRDKLNWKLCQPRRSRFIGR